MRKLSLFIAAFAIVFVLIAGCKAFQKVKEPVKVEMVLLTELTFHGEVSGVKGPAIFGDFSITHSIRALATEDKYVLEWLPLSEEIQTYFLIVVKAECPEPIALSSYNVDTEEATYWIYDDASQIWQVDEEKYDFFLTLDHPCVVEMPKGTDAMLRI